MWNEKTAEEFMERAARLGSVPGLENITNLMEELGNIQDELSVIHVAGTNGKGSTGAMLEKILVMSGYHTGRYSSPAVFCYEEKYQIDGIPVNKAEWNQILEKTAEACERLKGRGLPRPTLFEIETAAAFLWFYEQKCQVVILETGMGGALDATNIIKKPLCSVITSISMDHMAFLGNTLAEIARQKAGIIKEGCPVITAKQQPEVYEVLKKACAEKHTDLLMADDGAEKNIRYEEGYLTFDWTEFPDLKLSLLGMYQADNAVCAVSTIHRLNGLGFGIGDATIRLALKNTSWPGRFEVINKDPLTVIDGAHNEDAARELRKTLERGFTNYKKIYIIGVLADKEYEKLLIHMLPMAEKVYTVTPDNPRALSGKLLCETALKYHKNVQCADSIRQALANAKKDAEKMEHPMILAFGSLSYLGELKREIE